MQTAHVARFAQILADIEVLSKLALESNTSDIGGYDRTENEMELIAAVVLDPSEDGDEEFSLDFGFQKWPDGGLTVQFQGSGDYRLRYRRLSGTRQTSAGRLSWHSLDMKSRRRGAATVRTTGAPFLHAIASLPEKIDPDRYPFNIRAFSRGIDLAFRSKVTFFVGENGSGKSTLLEALAECCGFNPEGGSRNHHRATFANRSPLAAALRLSWRPKVTEGFFMRAESFYDFATYIEDVSPELRSTAANRSTSSPTGNPSLPCSPIASSRASTSWTSRRRRCRRNDSSRSSGSFTTSRHRGMRSFYRNALAHHPELPGSGPLRPRRGYRPGDQLS